MTFLNRLKIGTKVGGGFGLVMALLVVISAVSVFGMIRATNDFLEYRATARSTNEIGRVQANLLETRLNAKNFIIEASDQSIAAVRDRAAATLDLARTARDLAVRDEARDVLDRISNDMQRYVTRFDEVTRLQARRDELVLGTLNQVGPQMRKDLQDIMDSAFEDGDARAAYFAGTAMTRLMLMRLYVQRYLITNDQAAHDRVQDELAEFSVAEKALLAELQNPERRQLALAVDDGVGTYASAFAAVHETITARNDIITNELDRIGPEVARLSEELKLSNKGIQDVLGPAMTAEFNTLKVTVSVVAIIALLLGIAGSIIIGRSVSRPVTDITGAMKELADGDLKVHIPAQDHKDEVGEMAATLQVFKENMAKAEELRAEQERLREEETARKRAEAEREQAELARQREEEAKEAKRREEQLAREAEERRKEEERLKLELEKAEAFRRFADEVSVLADAAGRGDLTHRLDLDDKEGDILDVCRSLNTMIETVQNGVEETVGVMSAFATGDLSARMHGTYEGAFERLKDDSNATGEKLSEVVRTILGAADEFNAASVEIAQGSSDLSERTESQAASLEESAASIEQITSTVQNTAQNAQDASRVAGDATKIAEEGGKAVGDVVEAINQIDKSSEAISQITGVINDIAFQTNLLALNAAVEAARAGDAGKGFAVVAAEVRTLAQNSASAAKNIEELIRESSAGVGQGVKQVETAGQVFDKIAEAIKELSVMVESIADAASEQSIGIKEVSQAIAEMDGNTQRNAMLVGEVAGSAKMLEERAEGMQQLMSFFSVDSSKRALSSPAGFGEARDDLDGILPKQPLLPGRERA